MIIAGGRARSAGVRSHRPAPEAQGFRRPCQTGPAGRDTAAAGPVGWDGAAAIGHGSIPGSARRLDMRS